MDSTGLLVVGYVRRAHGVRGEVVIRLTTNRLERVAPGAELLTDDGALVVESSRPSDGDHLVRFAGVSDRNGADALRGAELRAEPIDDPDELWVHELIGARVVDQDGEDRGVVVAVQENPASDLLVLDTEALVPLRFVTSARDGVIEVDVPPGLFELVDP